MTAASLIELKQVTKTFHTAAGAFTALRQVDVRVEAGEFVAIVGKSGSGKSTMLNMIAGIDRPSTGSVMVADTAVHTLNENRAAIWRRQNIGIVFQFFQLLPTLTVVENIMLPMDFGNTCPSHARQPRALHLLARVGMTGQADKLPAELSGGEQQRVALCRALANDPPIIVADEPTGNLDSHTAGAVFALFRQLVDEGKTVLMVTHERGRIPGISRAVILADGAIVPDLPERAEESRP